MTQEEKSFLLKDLCARLPYGVKVYINSPIEEQNSMELFDVNLDSEHIGVGNKKWAFRAIPIIDDEDETKVVKPYLRPMSSMTEEERKEFDKVLKSCNNKVFACPEKERRYKFFDAEQEDFMNAHHFDFRNLIERGLAIDCTGLNIY